MVLTHVMVLAHGMVLSHVSGNLCFSPSRGWHGLSTWIASFTCLMVATPKLKVQLTNFIDHNDKPNFQVSLASNLEQPVFMEKNWHRKKIRTKRKEQKRVKIEMGRMIKRLLFYVRIQDVSLMICRSPIWLLEHCWTVLMKSGHLLAEKLIYNPLKKNLWGVFSLVPP